MFDAVSFASVDAVRQLIDAVDRLLTFVCRYDVRPIEIDGCVYADYQHLTQRQLGKLAALDVRVSGLAAILNLRLPRVPAGPVAQLDGVLRCTSHRARTARKTISRIHFLSVAR